MREPPYQIQICGVTYRIEVIHAGMFSHNGLGRTSAINSRIELSDALSPDQKILTSMHEVVHAILDNHGIEPPENILEPLVSALAIEFVRLVRDNPEYISYLNRSASKEELMEKAQKLMAGART